MIDEVEETRREEEELRRWREENARKKTQETEVVVPATGESAETGTMEATEMASTTESVEAAETISMTEPVEPAEEREESMDAEITPPSTRKRNYVIPKKSATSDLPVPGPSTSSGTRTTVKESLQRKEEEPIPKFETRVEVTVPEMVNGQFAKDMKRQWELVHDEQNPARRPWRWNLAKEGRMKWLRSKQVQPEYSMPRAKSKRIIEGHVMPEVPNYITKKWKESLI